MMEQQYKYVIIGGGLTGAQAAEGIREIDKGGSILLISNESHLPYHRPPLSKKLWTGAQKVEDIYAKDSNFYIKKDVEVVLGVEAAEVEPAEKVVIGSDGNRYRYQKLLLATGGFPRRLAIPGGNLEGIFYYRYLDDYLALRSQVDEGKSALVIGGGFIGSEMAAALNMNGADVTMVFPDPYLVNRVFPEGLGRAVQDDFLDRGVKVLAGDAPASIEKHEDKYLVWTKNGEDIEADIIVTGIGITPLVDLAEKAGLEIDNGIVVNELLQSSAPDIYAAGDNANFPYIALGERRRIEHWDNAFNQGKYAGRNMAGANEPYDYMPYFFSDLFDFGYEAVGDVTTKLDTFADWQEEYKTGVIYYLKDRKVKGVMLCNVWEKIDEARELIKEDKEMAPDDLIGRIR